MPLRSQMHHVSLQIESLRNELADDPKEFQCEMACLELYIRGQIKLAFQIAEERALERQYESSGPI